MNYINITFFFLIFVGCGSQINVELYQQEEKAIINLESASGGVGNLVSKTYLAVSQSLTLHAIVRDQEGTYIGEKEDVKWQLSGTSGPLVVSADGSYATFTAIKAGATNIIATSRSGEVIVQIVTLDNPDDFLIRGATGGADNNPDGVLSDGNELTLNWDDTKNESEYIVSLYENNEVTKKCETVKLAENTTSYTFKGCSLVGGKTYKAKVSAVGDLADTDVDATNDLYQIYVLPKLSINDISVNEGASTAELTVSLEAIADQDVSFNWSTSDGSAVSIEDLEDYVPNSGSEIISAGNLTSSISISLVDDVFDEDDQSFDVTISSVTMASINDSVASATIVDNDDPPTLTLMANSVSEGGIINFEITQSERSEKDVSFNFETSDGTATTAGGDYTAYSVTPFTINAGEDVSTPTIINVATNDDSINCEDDETLTGNLSSPTNATISVASAVATIFENDRPVISIDNASAIEGNTLTFNVSLNLTCPGTTVSFDWNTIGNSATGGKDFAHSSGTVSMTAPQNSSSFNVLTTDDSNVELSQESFFISINNISNALIDSSSNAIGTIIENDGGLGVAKVATERDLSCALSTSGDVECWGRDSQGNLGQDGFHFGDQVGEMGDNLPFVDLGTGVSAQKVVISKLHSCALMTDGKVKCWGNNENGVLGLGDEIGRGDNKNEMGDNLPFVELGTGRSAVDISIGPSVSCVILDDGSVKCWGGDWRNYGYSNSTNRGDGPGEMGDNLPTINLGTGRTAKKIDVSGTTNICAILDNDQLKCWGGSRGDSPEEMGDGLAPLDFGTGRTVKDITNNFYSQCVILDNNETKCWGSNGYGQLGIGNTSQISTPIGDDHPSVDLGTGLYATKLTSGYGFVCALLNNSQVKCWGRNLNGVGGQRGDQPGEMGDNLPFLDIGTGRTAVDISSNNDSSCVLRDDNAVLCWGRNTFGELGRENNSSDSILNGDTDTQVALGSGVVPASLAQGSWNDAGSGKGSYHCMVDTMGRVKCWGGNFNGRLGHGEKIIGDELNEMGANLAVIDLEGSPAKDILVGNGAACALMETGQVRCWGKGQILDGAVGDRPNELGANIQIPNFGTGRTAISLALLGRGGWTTACAILDNFQTKCWGDGNSSYGSLLNGQNSDINDDAGNSMPYINLGEGLYPLKISAGQAHYCAILNTNQVKCWGANWSGQLGIGNRDHMGQQQDEIGDNLPFVDLGSSGSVIDIASGNSHSCALFDNGGVKCWGRGESLGLGDSSDRGDDANEMADSLPFIDLGTGRTAVQIFSGNNAYSTCAILDDDSTKCWGDNAYGQLGLEDTINRGGGDGAMGDALSALDLGAGRTVISGSVGSSYTCVVLDNGVLKCFGANTSGQLGYEDIVQRGHQGSTMGDSLLSVDLF